MEPQILERLRLTVNLVSLVAYEQFRYQKDRLKDSAYFLGIVVLEGDCDLEVVRLHIRRMMENSSVQSENGVIELSEKWIFLDSTTNERYFRIDRNQECMHFITDISLDDLYILDPDFIPNISTNDMLPSLLVHRPADDDDSGVLIAQCSSAANSDSDDSLDRRLLMAARCGVLSQVKELLDGGADIRAVDPLGLTCLHLAAMCGATDLVEYLVQVSPSLLDLTCVDSSQTALHKACAKMNRGAARALVEAGATVTLTDSQGCTPRQQAQAAGDVDLVSWLESQEHLQLVNREDQETAV